MFASRYDIENVDFTKVRTNNGPSVLAKRSVNIYSDMGDSVREGDIITITAELIGFDDEPVSLQWQFDDGYYWVDVPGASQLTHSFVATAETVNYSWRLSVSVDE